MAGNAALCGGQPGTRVAEIVEAEREGPSAGAISAISLGAELLVSEESDMTFGRDFSSTPHCDFV